MRHEIFSTLFFVTDIDECTSSPCQNKATCVDLIDSFRCDCIPGFSGIVCENSMFLYCLREPFLYCLTFYLVLHIHKMWFWNNTNKSNSFFTQWLFGHVNLKYIAHMIWYFNLILNINEGLYFGILLVCFVLYVAHLELCV